MQRSFLVWISLPVSRPFPIASSHHKGRMESPSGQRGQCEVGTPGAAGISTERWETAMHDALFWFSMVQRLKPAPAASQEPHWEHREELWGWDRHSPVYIQPAGYKLKWARQDLRQDHPQSFLLHFVCSMHLASKTSASSPHGWAMVPGTHSTLSAGAEGSLLHQSHASGAAQPQRHKEGRVLTAKAVAAALRPEAWGLFSRTRKRDLC